MVVRDLPPNAIQLRNFCYKYTLTLYEHFFCIFQDEFLRR